MHYITNLLRQFSLFLQGILTGNLDMHPICPLHFNISLGEQYDSWTDCVLNLWFSSQTQSKRFFPKSIWFVSLNNPFASVTILQMFPISPPEKRKLSGSEKTWGWVNHTNTLRYLNISINSISYLKFTQMHLKINSYLFLPTCFHWRLLAIYTGNVILCTNLL